MPNYLDSGFDRFMDKIIDPGGAELSASDWDALVDTINASKINEGTMASVNKQMAMNLDKETFVINDGVSDIVKLGLLDNGEYGMEIKDGSGNLLIRFTGEETLMQGGTGKLQVDLANEQIRVYDDTDLRVLLGKAKGKF